MHVAAERPPPVRYFLQESLSVLRAYFLEPFLCSGRQCARSSPMPERLWSASQSHPNPTTFLCTSAVVFCPENALHHLAEMIKKTFLIFIRKLFNVYVSLTSSQNQHDQVTTEFHEIFCFNLFAHQIFVRSQ